MKMDGSTLDVELCVHLHECLRFKRRQKNILCPQRRTEFVWDYVQNNF